MEKIHSLAEYRTARGQYLEDSKRLLSDLGPENREDFWASKELIREEMLDRLQRLIDFRSEAGKKLGVTLHHTSNGSAWNGHMFVGAIVDLVPGMHNYWGTGVYFSEQDMVDFYGRRAQKETGDGEKPVTFILDALNVDGFDAFAHYADPKQGRGHHSNVAIVRVQIQEVTEEDNRIVARGTADRVPIPRGELRKLRKELGIKK